MFKYLQFLFITFFFPIASCSQENINPTPQADIIVDFGAPQTNVKSMSGFLHGINLSSPPDSVIDAVDPKLWRVSSFNSARRLSNLGVRPILVISDFLKDINPTIDTLILDERVRNILQETQNLNIIYDIWNEPDQEYFWPYSRQSFYQTFKRVHDIIRKELGYRVRISGPSSQWNYDYLNNFLSYCRKNKIQLDIISWHEFQYDYNLEKVKNNIETVRRDFFENDAYKSLGFQEVQINEFSFYEFHQVPALTLAYFYYMEGGGAHGACRASWVGGNDINALMGAIISNDGKFNPRNSFLTYKYYNLSLNNRVYSSGMNNIISFAHRGNFGKDKSQILLAYHNDQAQHAIVSLEIKNIERSVKYEANDSTVTLALYEIPKSGDDTVVRLKRITDELHPLNQTYIINDGYLLISDLKIPALTAYVIEIED